MKEYLQLPLPEEELRPYLRPVSPPLSLSDIALSIMDGSQRQKLKTPTCGTHTLILTYKGYEGAVTSLEAEGETLRVLQLQGAKSQRSYRLSTGLDWVSVFAKQINHVLNHPESPYERLVMPDPRFIEGLENNRHELEAAAQKYLEFIAVAQLSFSRDEKLYIKEVNK